MVKGEVRTEQWGRALKGATRCAVLGAVLCLAGCGYTLKGKAIYGAEPGVMVVSSKDARLSEPGVAGVLVRVSLDPGRLNEQRLSPARTDGNGELAMPITQAAGGLQTYELGVVADAGGGSVAGGEFQLPGPGQRVLIVVVPGGDSGRARGAGAGSPDGRSLEELLDEAEAIERGL